MKCLISSYRTSLLTKLIRFPLKIFFMDVSSFQEAFRLYLLIQYSHVNSINVLSLKKLGNVPRISHFIKTWKPISFQYSWALCWIEALLNVCFETKFIFIRIKETSLLSFQKLCPIFLHFAFFNVGVRCENDVEGRVMK